VATNALEIIGPVPRASIYGLYDKSGKLRYIGKANNPAERLKSHMRDARRRCKTPLHYWLLKHGVPEMRVLEADCEDWREAERRLIREFRSTGARLLNLAEGGDEPHCSPEVRSANGHTLNAMLRDDGPIGRVTRYKRKMGRYRREGFLTNETRDKLRALAAKRPDWFGLWKNLPTMEEEYGCSYDTPEWYEYVKAARWQKGKKRAD
jgi:hypothetical protein